MSLGFTMLMQEVVCGVVLVFTSCIVYLSASPLDPVRHMKGEFEVISATRIHVDGGIFPAKLAGSTKGVNHQKWRLLDPTQKKKMCANT